MFLCEGTVKLTKPRAIDISLCRFGEVTTAIQLSLIRQYLPQLNTTPEKPSNRRAARAAFMLFLQHQRPGRIKFLWTTTGHGVIIRHARGE
jgi:hypothetical protein